MTSGEWKLAINITAIAKEKNTKSHSADIYNINEELYFSLNKLTEHVYDTLMHIILTPPWNN